MPTTTGTCLTANEFLDDLMVYAQFQGWTLSRGAVALSDSGVFPFTSRYIRLDFSNSLFNESTTNEIGQSMRVASIGLRATVGGANLSLSPSNLTSSGANDGFPASNVLDGLGTTYWGCEPDNLATLTYDFGSAQTIREITLTSHTDGQYMPRSLSIYRSDDGINWGLVYSIPTVLSWAASTTGSFDLPVDGIIHDSSTVSGGVRRPVEYWLEGPGYDVARRVHLGFRSFYDFTTNNGGFDLIASTSFNSALEWEEQENTPASLPRAQMFSGGEECTYWIYINSTRIIAVLKTASGDYMSFYAGFLAAYGNPDQYPFPLYLGASTSVSANLRWDEVNPANGCFFDPGSLGGQVMDPLGLWSGVGNQSGTAGSVLDPLTSSDNFIYPWYTGSAISSYVSRSPSGSTAGSGSSHWLGNMLATVQGDLPAFDATLYNKTYGALGTLQGVTGLPGGGVLSPETTLTVGLSTYRIFPNRTRRLGNNWIAIKE